MKSFRLSISLLICLLSVSHTVQSSSALPVVKNYLEAKKLSAEEGKKIFAFFTDDNEKFAEVKDSEIAQIEENFIPLLVNINSFEGATLMDYYKVTQVPEILLLDETGAVIKRTNQKLQPSDLSIFLDIVDHSSDHILPTDISHNESKSSKISSTNNEEMNTSKSTSSPIENTTKDINSSPFFGVQTGVFSSIENAQSHSSQLKRLFNEKITIDQIQKEDKMLYKVIIGNFSDKKAAEKFNLILLDYNIKGFIKSISSGSKI